MISIVVGEYATGVSPPFAIGSDMAPNGMINMPCCPHNAHADLGQLKFKNPKAINFIST
jgi:hypothetical protein